MNKITSILFLYITFLPAFSYAAIPNIIKNNMAGALYTTQSTHATNTNEYDELKKTVTECVNRTKQENKSAPENYITNRANELKKNALTRNINYSTRVDFSTNDRQPKKFSCNITAKVGDFLKDKLQVQKVASTTNNIPTETAKQKCYETIARMVASDDWYVKECLTNETKKDYGIQDVDDYYKKIYSPFTSTKKSNNTTVASTQKPTIEPEHIDAPIYNDTNQSTVANFAPTPSMLSADTNTQQQYQEQIEEPTNQVIDLCDKSGGDWEQNTCNCEKYGMEYNKQTLRCTHTEIPTPEKRSYQQIQSNDFKPKKGTINEITTNDATTLISVSVVDHYDSSKKIKDIEICYENIESCKTTNKKGIATFTHNHIATEQISPKISVKTSSGYHCDEPINTSASMNLDVDNLIMGSEGYQSKQKNIIPADNTSFNFVVKCKQLCTDKDLKKVPNATKCYVKPDNQYEVSSCKNGYTTTTNKSACIEDNNNFIEEDIDTSFSSCDISGGTWNPQRNQCICDKDKSLKQSKDKKTCECKNSNETYNKKIDKCEKITTKTAQDIAIDNEFDRQNRINRLRDACKNSGGSYDQISQNIADSYVCNCQTNQTYNTQSGLCECAESGYIYSTKENKCIKPEITMDEYNQIEKGITEINDKTIASINTQCNNTQHAPTVCNSKEILIQQINDLQTQLLNDLKKMGANQ